MNQIALVVNPSKVSDAAGLTRALSARCADAGLPEPLVLETTPEDPGTSMAGHAVAAGARVVVAAGGDGTVRAVAQGLVGTGVALAVVPQGTGNLLVRNLDLPLDVDGALDAAVGGVDRRIDVGRLHGGGPGEGTVFAVMAGAGFDAAMMREAPEGLKAAVGWPAYLVGGARGLRRSHARVELRVDGGPPVRARVRTVVVGNLGRLQGGLQLLPDARPDDGLLDVALVSAHRPLDWVVLLVRALTGRNGHDHRLRTWQAREVDVRMHRAQPRQVDGDLVDDADHLRASVEPGALVVRVPRPEGPNATAGSSAAATDNASTTDADDVRDPEPTGQEQR